MPIIICSRIVPNGFCKTFSAFSYPVKPDENATAQLNMKDFQIKFMKQLLLLLLLIFPATILFSCKEECQNIRYDFEEIDSMSKNKNVSILLGADTLIDNETIFRKMDAVINHYVMTHEISEPKASIERYYLIDILLHHLFDYAVPKHEMTYVDFWCSLKVKKMQVEYLNYYLLNMISEEVDKSVSKYLLREKNVIDSLSLAQQNFLRTHLDEAYLEGSMEYCKYFNISTWLKKDYLWSLRDLLYALSYSKGVDTEYLEIKADKFDKEYRHIAVDLIPQKEIYDISFDTSYDEDRDRNAILNEQAKWEELMKLRREISKILPQRLKQTWDNSTYRFQRSHLILLKNEFEGLGITNNEMERVLLSNSCSYEELFSYPNFSTRWDQYMNENGFK